MGNLRRYYYQNKAKIWKVILIIASIIAVIQIANAFVKNKNQKEVEEAADRNTIAKNTTVQNGTTTIATDKSSVSGEKVEESKFDEDTQIIEKFFKFCNDKQYEKAYELISNDCKKEFYKDVSEFQEKYVKNIYENGTKKEIKVENWFSSTYKINISENIMETGNISAQSKQDYITIVRQDGEKKLNVNNLVEVYNNLNKSSTSNDITMTIVSRKIFMDYEEYTISINNKTRNTILLDTMQSTKTMYLLDNNNMKYYAHSHEISDRILKVNSGFSTQVTIKFSKSYSSTRTVESIVFSDLVLNYNENNNPQNSEKQSFSIEL